MSLLVPVYRHRPSPLHSARAGASAAFCTAFALLAMLHSHPLVLAAALAGVAGAGIAAGVGREMAGAALLALPLALLVTLVNPLVYREGDTLLLRGGEVLGRRFEVTLEALVAGGLAGLRVTAVMSAFALFSAVVDPDQLLRLFRRVSYRSALTASLATRLVPVLARDAARMGDAARCRPAPPGRTAVARAALARALDRAVDIAAALEVRGYSIASRPARSSRAWSRHDLSVALAAAVVATAGAAGTVAGVGVVEPYPRLALALGSPELLLAAVALIAATLPFAVPSARLGVARG